MCNYFLCLNYGIGTILLTVVQKCPLAKSGGMWQFTKTAWWERKNVTWEVKNDDGWRYWGKLWCTVFKSGRIDTWKHYLTKSICFWIRKKKMKELYSQQKLYHFSLFVLYEQKTYLILATKIHQFLEITFKFIRLLFIHLVYLMVYQLLVGYLILKFDSFSYVWL